MARNLITSGVINPFNFSIAQLRQEVTTLLNIPDSRIVKLECWKHQLWVNIQGVGGKFVSYRRFKVWREAAIAAIEKCTTQEGLDALGAVFRAETQHYSDYYEEEFIVTLRKAWKNKSNALQTEEEKMQPLRARLEAAAQWRESWFQILNYCQSIYSLKNLAKEIQDQSEEFLDLPDYTQSLDKRWHERWHELAHAIGEA